MPQYTFINPKTKKTITVFQKMTEPHIYFDEYGAAWNRVFEVPQARIDSVSSIDPFSSKDFLDKTSKKSVTVGSMWDISKELSEKRVKSSGRDSVREKTIENYEKKCKKPHPMKNS